VNVSKQSEYFDSGFAASARAAGAGARARARDRAWAGKVGTICQARKHNEGGALITAPSVIWLMSVMSSILANQDLPARTTRHTTRIPTLISDWIFKKAKASTKVKQKRK